jgi:dihydrofolate reductase
MGRIIAFESVTLDGVMQAPGRPDEDVRGGFQHGGWAAPYADEVTMGMAGEGMTTTGALLFGRRTYEDFYGFWPNQPDNPFTKISTRRRSTSPRARCENRCPGSIPRCYSVTCPPPSDR